VEITKWVDRVGSFVLKQNLVVRCGIRTGFIWMKVVFIGEILRQVIESSESLKKNYFGHLQDFQFHGKY
jgi:hypothetical protein